MRDPGRPDSSPDGATLGWWCEPTRGCRQELRSASTATRSVATSAARPSASTRGLPRRRAPATRPCSWRRCHARGAWPTARRSPGASARCGGRRCCTSRCSSVAAFCLRLTHAPGSRSRRSARRPAALEGWWPMLLSPTRRSARRGPRGAGLLTADRPAGPQPSALALSLSNSAWLIVPASSSALAPSVCAAGDLPATSRMGTRPGLGAAHRRRLPRRHAIAARRCR